MAFSVDISSLGYDRGCYINAPSIPPPIVTWTDFPEDDTFGWQNKNKFYNLCKADEDHFKQLLSGSHICSDCDFVHGLPKILDYSDGNKNNQVYLTLHRSSVRRVLVFNKTDVDMIRFFTPYAYSETVKRPIVFMLTDPASNFVAQSLFSVDINFGLQSDLLQTMHRFFSDRSLSPLPGMTSLLCKMIAIYRSRKDLVAVSAIVIDILLTWSVTIALAVQLWCMLKESVAFLLESLLPSNFTGQVDVCTFGLMLKPLVTILTCLTAVLTTAAVPGQKLIDSVLLRVGNIGRAVNGYKAITTAFSDVIDKIFNAIYETIFGVPYTEDSLVNFLEGLEVWYDEVGKLTTLKVTDSMTIDYKLCRTVEQLYIRGQDYLKRMKDLQLTRPQLEPFYNYWRILTKLYDRCITQGARKCEPRTEPVIIQLFGASGVGKSGLTYLLAQDLLVLEGLQEDVMDELYFRNVEQEFWDGYHGQAIVAYDDFGQKRDTDGNPNPEYLEVIRSGNIAPWPLHMAHLEDKARTRFTSRALILTSNERKYVMPSLTHATAVERRKDIVAEVVLKQKYKDINGRLDTSLVDPDELSTDIYEFILWEGDRSLKNMANCPERHSYEVFSGMCQRKYVEKFVASKSRLNFLKARGKTLTKERKAARKAAEQLAEKERLKEQYQTVFVAQVNDEEPPNFFRFSNPRPEVNPHSKYTMPSSDIVREEMEATGCTPDSIYARYKQEHAERERVRTTYHPELNPDLTVHRYIPRPDTIPAETIAFPYVWLIVNGSKDLFGNEEIERDIYIDDTLLNALKYEAAVSESFADFQIRARRVCVDKNYDFTQRFPNKEYVQENLLKVYSAKFRYYGKQTLKFAVQTTSEVFTLMSREIIAWWQRIIQGEFRANMQILYYGAIILLSYTGYSVTQKIVSEVKLAEEHSVAAASDPSLDLDNRDEFSGYDSDDSVDTIVPTFSAEGRRGTHRPVVCYACWKPGHWATECEIDKGIRERREEYMRQNPSIVAESKDTVKKTPKFHVAESKEVEKRPRKPVISELSAESKSEVVKKPRRSVVAETNLRPEYSYPKPRPIPDFEAEALIDVNSGELAASVLPRNIYCASTDRNGQWVPRVNLVFVHGRCAIMVAHAVPFFNRYLKIQNQYLSKGLIVEVSDLEFRPMTNSLGEELDCVLVVFPDNIPSHRSILKQFVTVEDLSHFNNVPGNLYTVWKDDGMFTRKQFALGNIQAIDTESYTTTPEDSIRRWTLRRGYQYHAETISGDCTALLVASCNKLSRKILGIHVAGADKGLALAQSITQDALRRVIETTPFVAQLNIELDATVIETSEPTLPTGDFIPVGQLQKPIGNSGKTNLRTSVLHGLVKPATTAPAQLTPFMKDGERIDPMMKGLMKCGTPNQVLDKSLAKRCVRSVFAKYNVGVRPEHIKTLTHEQSIMGIDGEEFIAPINRRSSPGYPWCNDRGGKSGKTKWLGSDDAYILDNKEVRRAVDERIQNAKLGILNPTLWIDTLKDERRPLAKVSEGKTRVFSAGAMDYILAFRRHYLGFFSYLMETRISNGSAVGINPYSTEWHRLALHLQKKGPFVVAGDFSNFDGSLIASCLQMICDEIFEWRKKWAMDLDVPFAEDDEYKIMKVLFEDIVNSTHICGRNVYKWTHSQPSGNPGTVIINTIFNEMMLRYVFVEITKLPLQMFDKYVSFIAYGDDNAANISTDILADFNQESITQAFSKIGLTYTDEQKTGEIVKYRKLREINFLKRGFLYDAYFKRFVAPLDLDTILEMTMWVRGDVDSDEKCATNVDLAYKELALHGVEIFNQYTTVLDKLCRRHLANPPLLYDFIDYKELEMEKWC